MGRRKRSRDRGRDAIPAAGPPPPPARLATRLHELLTSRWALPAILLLALALRVAHLVALHSTVWFANLDLDPRYFDEWGQKIAAGDVMGSKMFFVDPLYPYLLGVLYKIAGHDLLVVRLVQLALGLGTVALIAELGRRVASTAVGNGAALLYAVYRPAIFNEAEIEKTALATFLLLLAVVLIVRDRRRSILAGGATLGLAVLSRGNILLLALPIGLYLVREAGTWRVRRAALFAAGFVAILSPVAWRNHHVGGEWTLVTSAGQNFYQGNNPDNLTGSYGELPFVRPFPLYEEDDFHREAERRAGHAMSPGQVSRYWAGQALAHLAAHPGFALRMFGRKAELLGNDYEVPDNQDLYFVANFSPVLRVWLPTLGWLLPFAVVGVAASWRRRELRLLAIVLAVYGGSIVLFFVSGRYRMPIVPGLALFAALGVAWLVRAWRSARRRFAVAVAAMAATAAFAFHPPSFYDRGMSQALGWHNLGVLEARLGEDEAAVASCEKAAALLPDDADVLVDLGLLYLQAGRVDDAQQVLLRCVELNPELVTAWAGLGQLYQATHQLAEARAAYQKALALTPDDPELRQALDRLGSPPP